MSFLPHAVAVLFLAAEGDGGGPGALPGPGPWGARQWIGAALYVALFLAALWALSRLAAGSPPETGDDRS